MTTAAEPAIRAEYLTKRYGTLTAVRDLDLRVEKGQCFGLIGPNGAGKTTTLRMLATLLEPTDGEIFIEGVDAERDPSAVRRRIGFMPDHIAVYTELKVWEYLDYFAMAYAVPRAERATRIDDVIDLVDLKVKKNSFTTALSRGMRQRLCLAKTLVHDPSVLILDEPASGLDPLARIEFRGIMKELVRLGKTIIISSHILGELSEFCNAVGIMEKGRIVVGGAIDEILARIKGSAALRIEVLREPESLEAILGSSPHVLSCSLDGNVAQVEFGGDDEAIADLHAEIVSRGVRVKSFYEKKENLEDIFLRIGAHKVS